MLNIKNVLPKKTNTKTLYTCAWGEYWKRFGQKWLKEVELLNTKPNQIFVVSDKELPDCPYNVIIADPNSAPHPLNLFRQVALDNTICDWYCPSDIDDTMLPNYLDNLKDEYDAHTIWMTNSENSKKRIERWKKNSEQLWENMLNNSYNDINNPFPGRSFVKTELAKKVGYSKYGYEDYVFWLRFRLLDPTPKIYFDNEERFIYTNYTNNSSLNHLSLVDRRSKIRECVDIKKMLNSGKKYYDIENFSYK